MEYLPEVAKQGLGYLLFVLSCIVIVYLYRKLEEKERQNQDLSNRRLEDIVEMKDAYMDQAQSHKEVQLGYSHQMQEMAKSLVQIASDVRNIITRQDRP